MKDIEKSDKFLNGIITQSGAICKDKINLVAGAVTQPFSEMIWTVTGGDKETINRITEILVSMNTAADRKKLFKFIQILYGVLGLQFSDEAAYMQLNDDALAYFLFSFTADFGEIMQEYFVG